MYLSDKDIKKAVMSGEITIKDFDGKRLGPASYDICLGTKFMVTQSHATKYIDPVNHVAPLLYEVNLKEGDEYILHPGVSILGTSKDFFGSRKYLIQLHGKSSLARIGLMVHNTAGLINPGHFLNITFELCNLNKVPIILRPGMQIGQLTFIELSSEPEKDYADFGRYHKNDWNGYIPSKDHKSGLKAKVLAKKVTKSKK